MEMLARAFIVFGVGNIRRLDQNASLAGSLVDGENDAK